MDRKGKTNGLTIFLIVMAVGIFGSALWFGFGDQIGGKGTAQSVFQQAVVDGDANSDELNKASAILNNGDVATLKLTAEDRGLRSSQVRLGINTYCWKDGKETSILGGPTGVSLSATSSGGDAVPGVNRNDALTCVAFNTSYQGTPKIVNVVGESLSDKLDVFQTASYLRVTPFDKDGQTGGAGRTEFDHNISIGPSGSDTFRYKVENNASNNIFRLGAMAFDLTPSTNITTIDASSDVEQSGLSDTSPITLSSSPMLQRLTEYNKLYVFKQGSSPYVELGENDYVKTGVIKFTGNGNGCNTRNAGGEGVTSVAFIDVARFTMLSGDNRGAVTLGLEDDAPTPADVGRSDITRTLKCSAS